jgi:hypothetical protein
MLWQFPSFDWSSRISTKETAIKKPGEQQGSPGLAQMGGTHFIA